MAPIGAATLLAVGSTPTQAAIGTALLVGSHLICSYWLSPDLDLDSAIDDRWGPLRFIWLPYQKAVPHRHWFSHSGFSALFRLLYLGVIIGAVVFLVGLLIEGAPGRVADWMIGFIQERPVVVALILLGAVISDVIHTLSDLLSTWLKRRFRARARARIRARRRRRRRR
jgi:uncharacterized metal-binding protein